MKNKIDISIKFLIDNIPKYLRKFYYKNNNLSESKIKNVLIISPCFVGGGLERRINSIVNKYHELYNFSLLTKTAVNDMKIEPSQYFRKIYSWDEQAIAIKEADILSLHPFNIERDLMELPSDKTIIYTLHGEASLTEDLSRLGQKVDLFYSVSKKVIELFKITYPEYSHKIKLFKNFYPNELKDTNENIDNCCYNVLFSITNENNWDYLNDIIKRIPDKYTIHLIGHTPNKKYEHKNIVYNGFVDIKKFMKEKTFCFAFARGGFAAMDLIAKDIPTILVYNRETKVYIELLSKKNFKHLSNNNFVTWKPYNPKNFDKIINNIENKRLTYTLKNKLKQENDISLMPDPYKKLQ